MLCAVSDVISKQHTVRSLQCLQNGASERIGSPVSLLNLTAHWGVGGPRPVEPHGVAGAGQEKGKLEFKF